MTTHQREENNVTYTLTDIGQPREVMRITQDGVFVFPDIAVDEALAQPEQELVGVEWTPCIKRPHVVVHVRQQRRGETHISTREGITPVKPDDLIMRGVEDEEYPIGRVLFLKTYSFDTSPPQPEWVGLTDTEIKRIGALDVDSNYFGLWYDFAKAIEAKLKEKNT
jgi:hypothetical protein